jgi:hypothetical protein
MDFPGGRRLSPGLQQGRIVEGDDELLGNLAVEDTSNARSTNTGANMPDSARSARTDEHRANTRRFRVLEPREGSRDGGPTGTRHHRPCRFYCPTRAAESHRRIRPCAPKSPAHRLFPTA